MRGEEEGIHVKWKCSILCIQDTVEEKTRMQNKTDIKYNCILQWCVRVCVCMRGREVSTHEYAGDVGEYAGEVGLYAGEVGLYAGEVGEYAGLDGE